MTTTVKEINVGITRYYASCPEHPDWHPGSKYTRHQAESDAQTHEASPPHDDIDYAAMPATLADAIMGLDSRKLRIRIARAAIHWKEDDSR